jgi:L-ribulokinase
MTVVAGVDFGTLSVRVSIVDDTRGVLGAAMAEYPVHRAVQDPHLATQSHDDHMRALVEAVRGAMKDAGVHGARIASIALATTGSSVVPVDGHCQPLGEYYLWCDHRASGEAAEITEAARATGLPALEWCGGTYSAEWGWAKLLHWLRHSPDVRDMWASAFEHCDLVAATLSGVQYPRLAKRGACSMGHKWLWGERWGGLPSSAFLAGVDPLLEGARDKLAGTVCTSDELAGHLTPKWAAETGLRAGIPIPVGAFDAHWDAVGAGIALGDVVNVIGTSTCMIAMTNEATPIPGVCGVVPGSVHPRYVGIEAGLSATGDVLDRIAFRAGVTVTRLSAGLEQYMAGQTGLLRIPWDNGDRTVLVNAELGGVTLGWTLGHTAQDELFAAIEGLAMHTRVIVERMRAHGVPVRRVINAGGVPQKNFVLNQVYANVLGVPVLVPERPTTGLGAAMFASVAARAHRTIDDAQSALCPGYRVFLPEATAVATYETLYRCFTRMYHGLGEPRGAAVVIGDVLPTLQRVAAGVRRHVAVA